MSLDESSYLMGIFDGEGWITAQAKPERDRWSLTIGVTMGNEAVVKMFADRWGGRVNRVKVKEGRMPLWRWQVGASKALPFLRIAAQHCIVKKRHAEIAVMLGEELAKYNNESRKGVAVSRGHKFVTQTDRQARSRLVAELRSINGARSRFGLQGHIAP
jgi:hypothetical protein